MVKGIVKIEWEPERPGFVNHQQEPKRLWVGLYEGRHRLLGVSIREGISISRGYFPLTRNHDLTPYVIHVATE